MLFEHLYLAITTGSVTFFSTAALLLYLLDHTSLETQRCSAVSFTGLACFWWKHELTWINSKLFETGYQSCEQDAISSSYRWYDTGTSPIDLVSPDSLTQPEIQEGRRPLRKQYIPFNLMDLHHIKFFMNEATTNGSQSALKGPGTLFLYLCNITD